MFESIKRGEIPEESIIFYLLENEVEDKNPEIKKYIEILKDALIKVDNIQEEILIIRTLFVLESLYLTQQEAIKNFVIRSFYIFIHEANEYVNVMRQVLSKLDIDFVLESLNEELLNLANKDYYKLRSFFAWNLHVLWHIEKYYNHPKWKSWYENLQILLDELMKQDRISEVMYVEFFTYHIMGNSFQTIDEWRDYNKKIIKKTEKFYKMNLPLANPSKKKRKRIAFVKDRVVINSPFMVEYSLLKALKEDKEFNEKYEIAGVYSVNYFEKSEDQLKAVEMLKKLGINYINPVEEFQDYGYYNDHFKKALKVRDRLIKDDIDIIIMGGAMPILDFLYINKTAPKMIYYSHGNCAFDVEGIDKRISHFNQECKEFEWEIFNVPMAEEFLIGTKEDKEKGLALKEALKETFGKDTVILGTIGRLVKIDSDEYLKVIGEIMRENLNTIYLACGEGNQESIKEKLKKYNIPEDRFIFTGVINPHIFGWVIDIWPDSFPLGQGQSKEEFIAKKRPVIFHIKRGIKLDDINKIFIAVDDKDYIEKMNLCIKDISLRETIANLQYKLWFNQFVLKNWENILKE